MSFDQASHNLATMLVGFLPVVLGFLLVWLGVPQRAAQKRSGKPYLFSVFIEMLVSTFLFWIGCLMSLGALLEAAQIERAKQMAPFLAMPIAVIYTLLFSTIQLWRQLPGKTPPAPKS